MKQQSEIIRGLLDTRCGEEEKERHERLVRALENVPTNSFQADINQPKPDPVAWLVTDEDINSLQVNSIRRIIERCKHAHYTDLIIRINGKDEHYEADWIKHLKETRPAPAKP